MARFGEGQEDRWLTLAEASALLGVHRVTLRAWADAGHVRSFRTPGGHRRFLAAEVEALIAGAGQARGPAGGGLAEQLVSHARQELSVLAPESNSWLLAFSGDERTWWRDLGRQLVGLAIQYVSRRQGVEAVLAEGRSIGVHYGRQCALHRLPLADTVRAFLFFRESLLRAARPGTVARGRYDDEDVRIHREMRAFLDEVLYATLGAYEETCRSLLAGGQ